MEHDRDKAAAAPMTLDLTFTTCLFRQVVPYGIHRSLRVVTSDRSHALYKQDCDIVNQVNTLPGSLRDDLMRFMGADKVDAARLTEVLFANKKQSQTDRVLGT